MPNVNKQSYALAVLTPIIAGRTDGVVHLAELRAVLARLGTDAKAPFAKVPGTHFARWTVLDDPPQLGLPTASDLLQSKYLILEADFDGDRNAWIESLRTEAPAVVAQVYAHCLGFPGVHDATAFRRYLVAGQLETALDFSPFAENPLPTVLRALETQRQFVGFAHAVQGRSNRELQTAFRQFVAQRRAPESSADDR